MTKRLKEVKYLLFWMPISTFGYNPKPVIEIKDK